MKTSFGAVKLVIVLTIVALAIWSYRAVATPPPAPQTNPNYKDKKFELKFKEQDNVRPQFKNGDEAAFNAALQKFADDQIDLTVKRDTGADSHYPPKPKGASMKTDKVTTSELAQRAADGDLTPIGTNVITKVSSASAQDITDILNTLK
jgi:hypothetical protein